MTTWAAKLVRPGYWFIKSEATAKEISMGRGKLWMGLCGRGSGAQRTAPVWIVLAPETWRAMSLVGLTPWQLPEDWWVALASPQAEVENHSQKNTLGHFFGSQVF